jgi:hypothetical protein
MRACRWGGIIIIAALISGALAGLAGAGEVAGSATRSPPTFPSGYGYAGIVIATLAELDPARGGSCRIVLCHHLQRRRARWRGQPACPVYLRRRDPGRGAGDPLVAREAFCDRIG